MSLVKDNSTPFMLASFILNFRHGVLYGRLTSILEYQWFLQCVSE